MTTEDQYSLSDFELTADAAEVAVELDPVPEDIPEEQDNDEDEAILENEFIVEDSPPIIELSFAERVAALTNELWVACEDLPRIEPENLVEVDYYDRAHGGQGYMGKLYLTDAGVEYKLITWDNKTIYLDQLGVPS